MSEIFFILTVIYVAYVVYAVGDHDTSNESNIAANPGAVAFQQKKASTDSSTEKNGSSTPVKQEKTAAPAKPKVNKLAAPKVELRTVMMKNQTTGEQAKVATNYRMVKRWVKEALVEEGLLDKIYKNTELDEEAKIKVAKALSIIKAMDKYKA